jgi:hypothetical protein
MGHSNEGATKLVEGKVLVDDHSNVISLMLTL